jgi:hypothetical protein
MANVCDRSKREKEAEGYRKEATGMIEKIAERLKPSAKERYLQHPAVRSAYGESPPESGLWKVPLQIRPPKAQRPENSDGSMHHLKPIFDIIKKINSELNLRNLITLILDTMIEYCNAQRGTLVIFEGERFKVELSRNRHKENLKRSETPGRTGA